MAVMQVTTLQPPLRSAMHVGRATTARPNGSPSTRSRFAAPKARGPLQPASGLHLNAIPVQLELCSPTLDGAQKKPASLVSRVMHVPQELLNSDQALALQVNMLTPRPSLTP